MVTFKRLSELRCELVAHTVVPQQKMSGTALREAGFLPVSAARVSHGREDKTGDDPAKDMKLMAFLAEHKHLSPFEHQSATFLVEAPLYIAREWMRHRTQAFNEISMRYTSDPSDTYYIPDTFRAQAAKNKQASEGEAADQDTCARIYKYGVIEAVDSYNRLLASGVARELARGVLPTSMVTRFYATANLRNWAHWYGLRSGVGAQLEIRHYAEQINQHLKALWPEAWQVLTGEYTDV
jgi:thymidylate synthase (FAD)